MEGLFNAIGNIVAMCGVAFLVASSATIGVIMAAKAMISWPIQVRFIHTRRPVIIPGAARAK